MDKLKQILENALNNDHYFTNEDLRVNRKYNYLLSNNELNDYLKYKDDLESTRKIELPLKSFNSKNVYYNSSAQLLSITKDYLQFLKFDLDNTNSTIISESYDEMILSRLASELDGSLQIEGVNTTRKQILNVVTNKKQKLDTNDIIIKNMYNGYKFILGNPKFNKDNLKTLYNLLSNHQLKDKYYRDEAVYISSHMGCDADKIDECMDSLFSYVNNELSNNNIYLSFIVHYYILYIHPYFDYNGRTARMVSLWISLLSDNKNVSPIYISEAINDDKNNYYRAIDNSRYSNNDLTYFLTYLFKLSNTYYLLYKNLNQIVNTLSLNGDKLTNTETYYLKRIMANSKKGWFNYKGFLKLANVDITKQAALKILNNFLKLGLLVSKTNSKNEKIFKLNDEKILFELN